MSWLYSFQCGNILHTDWQQSKFICWAPNVFYPLCQRSFVHTLWDLPVKLHGRRSVFLLLGTYATLAISQYLICLSLAIDETTRVCWHLRSFRRRSDVTCELRRLFPLATWLFFKSLYPDWQQINHTSFVLSTLCAGNPPETLLFPCPKIMFEWMTLTPFKQYWLYIFKRSWIDFYTVKMCKGVLNI